MENATIRLVFAADIQPGLLKKVSYQRNEKLLGGKERKRLSENDMGTTMSSGRIKKISTTTT
ncbi:hypothetical protein HORIV_47360 [Vreelandella olivaria]|uniref:Uncharacterized protein n=1 Tax=Vreelandella olivaria TaxID=390919 RepID=A0ABM7GMU9_9GAMM|nr:hypothetical protein HORIV_47360 [Halomonas olivaria]